MQTFHSKSLGARLLLEVRFSFELGLWSLELKFHQRTGVDVFVFLFAFLNCVSNRADTCSFLYVVRGPVVRGPVVRDPEIPCPVVACSVVACLVGSLPCHGLCNSCIWLLPLRDNSEPVETV